MSNRIYPVQSGTPLGLCNCATCHVGKNADNDM